MLAVIGGSGLYDLVGSGSVEQLKIKTEYSNNYVFLERVEFFNKTFYFLPRHGKGHTVPPHKINYRSNIEALSLLGVKKIIAACTVGGISKNNFPGTLCLPDQIIDYTWGREQTFFDDFDHGLTHIDFTHPFSKNICDKIIAAAKSLDLILNSGCYACMQGPRLETKAEIVRLEKDGCDIVGMTLMPEAALAREKGINYGAVSLVVNWAAGKSKKEINLDEIKTTFDACVPSVKRLILESVKLF